MEEISEHVFGHVQEEVIEKSQCGFTEGKSCLTHLPSTTK